MKVQVNEAEGSFGLTLSAETMVEASLLTRLGMNSIAELRTFYSDARADGTFHTIVVFGKHKRADSSIPKRSRRSRS